MISYTITWVWAPQILVRHRMHRFYVKFVDFKKIVHSWSGAFLKDEYTKKEAVALCTKGFAKVHMFNPIKKLKLCQGLVYRLPTPWMADHDKCLLTCLDHQK